MARDAAWGGETLPGSDLEKRGQKRVGLEHVAQSQELMAGQPAQLQAGGHRGRRLTDGLE